MKQAYAMLLNISIQFFGKLFHCREYGFKLLLHVVSGLAFGNSLIFRQSKLTQVLGGYCHSTMKSKRVI